MPPTPSPSVAEPVAFADTDIKSASEDRLSRAPFAKRVADLIKGIPQGADSTVIGVIGPWGGGKTSILNLIRTELSQDKAMGIAQFTPWAVGDSNALMVEFFATLLNSHESLSEAKEKHKFQDLAKKLTPALAGFGALGKAAEGVAQAFLTDGNWQKQFDELDRMISASGARILITVDDVDRLHGEEILTLVKTIRMLGRFHNVHYVLAYDHAALVDALSPGLGGNRRRAAEYLEKIVQYPLDIPPAQEVQLQAMLDEGLSPLFQQDVATILSDAQGRFQLLYSQELKRHLTTARSVKRFVAQANHYFALVSEHVDVSDFLLLTFLRLHFPALYNRLPAWRADLTTQRTGVPQELAESSRALWTGRLKDAHIADSEEQNGLMNVLKELFPAGLGSSTAGAQVGRVGNPRYFDRYFVFGLPEGDLSDQRVREDFLSAAAKGELQEATFAGTFTSPSSKVRMLAVEKAEPLVAEAELHTVPQLTRFVIWLMNRESELDPRYMFGTMLGDLLVRHPGFETDEQWESLLRELPGVRALRSALERVYSQTRNYSLSEEDDPAVWQMLRRPISAVGAEDVISLAKAGNSSWRDFMETYAVLSSHGDLHTAREAVSSAVSAGELDLLQLAAFFVYPEIRRQDMGYQLQDLDIDRLLTLVDADELREFELPPYESAMGMDRNRVSWEARMNLAIGGIDKWRQQRQLAESDSQSVPN
jgi:hypothetical protein